ncbi:HEPN domain-containing protein [Shewanella psychropiezotolerans]|uniref:HEPN domain-containing protein n=1 Tax=Shewanella psychropiezotolerans TaxID=2593655 RepID=A0ABX5WTZ0_9GAMM|nr:HEPN domain-containing protein [Shewanella psychropiezotolerans]QDO82474.1 HEPN domain-containing protein [Shewanella psychropiezotolerans]
MKMKTSLEHLPEQKIHELKRAVATIRQFVEPQMIILFGSYARGDWVEDLDPDTLQFRYQSDFDLLVVMETRQQASHVEQNERLSQALMKPIQRTPVSVIAEDLAFINRRISKSQYFYIDIKREGIMLYDTGNFTIGEAKELTALERSLLAQEDYDYWMKNADEFLITYSFMVSQNFLSNAAFLLHQVTEKLYSAILLVFTRYKPSVHDLKKLGGLVAGIEPEFLTVFPQGT